MVHGRFEDREQLHRKQTIGLVNARAEELIAKGKRKGLTGIALYHFVEKGLTARGLYHPWPAPNAARRRWSAIFRR